jgi:hypothetical protein
MSVSSKFCQMCYAALKNLQQCHGHDCYAKGSTWELQIIPKGTQFGKLPEAMLWHHVYGIHEPIQTMNERMKLRNLFHLRER